MKKENVILELDGQRIECTQSFDYASKKFTLEYFINDFQEPLTKEFLRYVKEKYRPFGIIFRTNAGLEIHSAEMENNTWNDIKILRTPNR